MIPSLRDKILKTVDSRSANPYRNKKILNDAASAYYRSKQKERISLSPTPDVPRDIQESIGEKHRLGQMEMLRRPPQGKSRLELLQGLARELDALKEHRPEDLHLRAVLGHQIERLKSRDLEPGAQAEQSKEKPVGELYRLAVEAYLKLPSPGQPRPGRPPQANPLLALCYADWGLYLLRQRHPEAAEKFLLARSLFKISERPLHFIVHAYCREAEALRTASNWDAAFKRLESARQMAVYENEKNPDPTLVAFVLENRAWTRITRWQIDQAAEDFAQAEAIRKSQADKGDHDSAILRFHNLHGLAMATRFQGRIDDEVGPASKSRPGALRRYSDLLIEIRAAIKQYEDEGDREVDLRCFRAGLERLYERLVNSMERLGDCLFFRENPDYLEAARFYGKARNHRHQIPVDQADLVRSGCC